MHGPGRNGGGDLVSTTERPPPASAPPAATSPAHPAPVDERAAKLDRAREAITWFRDMEDREQDKAPLNAALIKRILTYTRPYAARRNWLFVLTFVRGL